MKDREGAALEDLLRPGEVLAGKYRIERILGTGAMGVVAAAYHLDLEQPVAIKLMRPEIAQETDAVERFLREARAAARIQSEHVVRIHDVSRLASGAPYIVMEHLSGMDLDQVVRKRAALPIEEAVDYVLQACEALAEAHAQGIVHRDLKPSNLFLARRADGSALVKVLDFGISKVNGGGQALERSLTGTTQAIGTPLYMSPEQIRSTKGVDARTDVWALGVILHRLLTGGHAFEAGDMAACLARIMVDPPVLLRAKRPEAPADLETVILACLEKDRERRIQDLAELTRRLRPFASVHAQASVKRVIRVLRGPDTEPTTVPAARRVDDVDARAAEASLEVVDAHAERAPSVDPAPGAWTAQGAEGSAPALSSSQPSVPMQQPEPSAPPARRKKLAYATVGAALVICAAALTLSGVTRGWLRGQEDDAGTSPVSTTTTVVSAAPPEGVSAADSADVAPTTAPSSAPVVAVTPAASALSPIPVSPLPGERLQTGRRTGGAMDSPYGDPGATSDARGAPAPQGTAASKGSAGKGKKGPIVDSL